MLYIVARVAPGTGLYAVGRAIIDAGFGGVRDVSTSGVTQFWKFRRDTPEGEFLERLCCLARQGLPLPPPNEAVALLRAFSWAGEVRV
ncbi:hypothetical protein CNE_1c33160 [Cupriavidus necator N-1]|uniref:Uncharacterized protein n=1 Tax=Cupriavidus necator (strain ATCC 43291 / DSM 13513 / CCUG 52238 / LMG 8453 / N-1) TaxID=1042878 RepID=G0EY08_CUPNN|nr:hypothetical protein CNE_1c33160 [Cupriavidus necator N-1]